MKVQWRQDHMAEEEAGTEGPMAPYSRELDGWPPTVPVDIKEGILVHHGNAAEHF